MKGILVRKGAVGFILFVLMMVAAGPLTNTSVRGNDEQSGMTEQVSYTFSFAPPILGTIKSADATFTKIDMPGCLELGKQAGDPATPVKIVQLILSPKKAVSSVTVTGTPVTVTHSGTDLTARPIIPQQKPIPFGSGEPQHFVINSDIYSSDAFYPSTLYSNEQVGYSHGYAILSLSLDPVQYNPKQGALVYYPKLTVSITLQTDNTVNKFYRNRPDDLAYVKTLVSNPEVADYYPLANLPVASYPGGLCDPSQHYDYVIVTTTENGLDHWAIGGTLTYNWSSLIALHNAEGLSCTEVLVQDIVACPDYWNTSYYPLFNDTQAKIREFCKDAYSDWGTKYVLFAGDADANALPPRLMDNAYESGVDADLYWSNLDNSFNGDHDSQWGEEGDPGFDYYHELDIGRIPCESPQDVSNWLTKSLYYADATDSNYLENGGFYGGDTGWDIQGDDIIDFAAIKGTDHWLGPNPGQWPGFLGFLYGFETWNAVNPGNAFNLSVKWSAAPSPNPGWQGGDYVTAVTGFRNAINNDSVTLITGVGHADTHMSLDVYDTDWVTLYHNTKPFFIRDLGTHCGDFDAGNGILDSMLFHSNISLAFGCLYNSGYTWIVGYNNTNGSDALQTKLFWDYFFDVENNSHSLLNWQLGEAQGWSKDKMAPTINWSEFGSWRETIQCSLLFGDPAQTIKTPHPSNPPAKPSTPVGPTHGIWHVEYTYTSNTTDPDQVSYLFDWGDGTNSGWLPTGVGKHIWNEPGTYDVKVKARDTWGACSQWSDPLIVVITNGTPPSVPIITGPSSGKPGNPYLFNFQSDDAQGHSIWYFIDWGDGSNSSWLGPYVPGTIVHASHTWNKRGTYTIKAKAKDIYAESDWGTLQVTMPLVYEPPHFRFFDWLFERFPHAFPILRFLLNR
jgi:hypothetical protein